MQTELIKALKDLANVLQPFTKSGVAGAREWNGSAYVETSESKEPDPYALAWWSTLNTVAGLIESQEGLLADRQKQYLRHILFGGMGSLSDLHLNEDRWGQAARDANRSLQDKLCDMETLLS